MKHVYIKNTVLAFLQKKQAHLEPVSSRLIREEIGISERKARQSLKALENEGKVVGFLMKTGKHWYLHVEDKAGQVLHLMKDRIGWLHKVMLRDIRLATGLSDPALLLLLAQMQTKGLIALRIETNGLIKLRFPSSAQTSE